MPLPLQCAWGRCLEVGVFTQLDHAVRSQPKARNKAQWPWSVRVGLLASKASDELVLVNATGAEVGGATTESGRLGSFTLGLRWRLES